MSATRVARIVAGSIMLVIGGALVAGLAFGALSSQYREPWWLTAGYHTLTVLFLFNTAVYAYAAFH